MAGHDVLKFPAYGALLLRPRRRWRPGRAERFVEGRRTSPGAGWRLRARLLANLMRARHRALGRLNGDRFSPANGCALRGGESRLRGGKSSKARKAKGGDEYVTHFKVLMDSLVTRRVGSTNQFADTPLAGFFQAVRSRIDRAQSICVRIKLRLNKCAQFRMGESKKIFFLARHAHC